MSSRTLALPIAVSVALFWPLSAGAQASGDEAAARALFEEGRRLMDQGKVSEACPKFEEGQRLSPGIGMKFNLAECYERQGRLASAWGAFLDVAASARAQNQSEREKIARRRAAALEPELARLTIQVPPQSIVPGLEIQRGDVPVGRGQWGTPIPVDAGEYVVRASAPGRKTFETKVRVEGTSGAKAEMTIPALAIDPNAAHRGGPSSDANTGQTQRTIGLVAGGVGLLAMGVGATFGFLAINRMGASNVHCYPGNRCDDVGIGLRNDAITEGNISTVTILTGTALLGTGALLYLFAPSPHAPQVGLGLGRATVRVAF